MTERWLGHIYNISGILRELYYPHTMSIGTAIEKTSNLAEILAILDARDSLALLLPVIEMLKTTPQDNAAIAPMVDGPRLLALSKAIEKIMAMFARDMGGYFFVLVERSATIESLRELTKNVTDDTERELLENTLTCLQVRAYRAAMVMGWNAAFDKFRKWIFKSPRKRLKLFNQEAAIRNEKPVADYDDFFLIGEKQILDIAYKVKLINKQKHQILCNCLTDRNHFAHASDRKSSSASAVGYVETLMIEVLRSPDFQ